MTSTDLIAHYRHLAEDNRVLALDHKRTSTSLLKIAAEYDSIADALEQVTGLRPRNGLVVQRAAVRVVARRSLTN
jgi:hypothetical protein